MKKKLKLLSAIIIFSMVFPLITGLLQPVFAADIPIRVYVDSYNASTATVNIHWDPVPNVQSGTVQYHVPNGATYDTVQVPIDPTKNSASISGIRNDIIYDLSVSIMDNSSQVYTGKQYFLPQISFYAEQVDQQPVNIQGGGVESGVYPTVKLTWTMPRVFNGSSMAYANEALGQIGDGNIAKLNFTIHSIVTSTKTLADIEVSMQNNGQYTAAISHDPDSSRYSWVNFDRNTGKMSLYVMGVKDDSTIIPDIASIRAGTAPMPQKIVTAGEANYVLPHSEIRPGTVYKMTMNAMFTDSNNQYVGAVAEGLPENPLMGATDYTYTPIRFQLTKDTFDNVYVRIFRINQGGLAMPRLYYEIQTSNVASDQDTSWMTRKKLDDTYFTGPYAITVVTGINSKNTVYYRVVVKSDGVTDRIQSLKLPYTMQEDTARPPVPKGVVVSGINLAISNDPDITDRSSDITVSWDKPSNWDQIKGHLEKDLYFHFMISTAAKDLDDTPRRLEANGSYYGAYPVKYRLVKYISANSNKIKDNGTKLSYTIEGFKLFEGEDDEGNIFPIANTEGYPEYFLPNMTYYLQVYTTVYANKGQVYDGSANMDDSGFSDRSLTVSFTTLSPTGRDVPIPYNFEWVKTTMKPASASGPANATVQVRFDDLKIDWSNYTTKHDNNDAVIYDLYMSTRTDPTSFVQIGTTDPASTDYDVAFTKQNLGNTTWVYADINKFTKQNKINAFGEYLRPNSTYYFMLKVRLKLVNEVPTYKTSVETALLPVTTPTGEPGVPDDSQKKPLAPTDFAIALDANGNRMITGQTVTFEWTVKENSAVYNLIATSQRVASDTPAGDNSILQDSVFKSFITSFGNKDNNSDGNPMKLSLNPNMDPMAPGLTYDSKTKKCRYTINTWLYPNKIYYFSLRSEIPDSRGNERDSVWISIPVTTSLIEPPSQLQAVSGCEIGFYWFDTMPNMTAENYQIKLKTSTESSYTLLPKSQYTIVKNGSIYYGRLLKLKPNTEYNIQVVRAGDNVVLSNLTRNTREDHYQIDVRWQGYAIDPYSGFEIAIRTEDDSDYVLLDNNVDLEQYVDITTHTYPYYIEKINSNLSTNYFTYNVRIKLAPTKLPDGTIEHRPLKPNTKYYIKVRAVKVDSTDQTAVTPSKYIGPVNTRTEFSQDDYDDNDNNTGVVAKFLDMLDKLEQDIYWEVNMKNGVTNKLLVKDQRVVNLLAGYGNFTCTIDVTRNPAYVNTDEIYLAQDILKAMKSNNKSIIIRTKDIEYTIRPDTFNPDTMEEFKSAKAASGSKDVFLKINNTQSTSVQPAAPAGTSVSSQMNVLSAQAVASRQTAEAINGLIKDKLYNDTTGIIKKKLDVIKNPNNTYVKGSADAVGNYLNQLIEEVKNELSYYLEDMLNGSGYTQGAFADQYGISKFSASLGVKMAYKTGTKANPYMLTGNSGSWQKLTQNIKNENGYLNFFISGTGNYAVFSSKDIADTVSEDNAAKPYIAKLGENYDLSLVFPGADVSFNSDLSVTVKEAVLLYELLSEATVDSQSDIKTKAKLYGIDKIINVSNTYRNITRQEAAAIAVKLYCQRTGTDYNKLSASYSGTIKDDGQISEKYAAPVYLCLQMKLMTLDSASKFNPAASINRAGLVMVLEKVLEA